MKRSLALKELSRDHQNALAIALALRRAGPDDRAEARANFLAFWRGHGSRHFRIEEEVLLPRFAARGGASEPSVRRVLEEHAAIRYLALELEDGEASLDSLRRLGQQLGEHVRL